MRARPDVHRGHTPTGGAHSSHDGCASPEVYPGITRGHPRHDPSSDRASSERSAAARLFSPASLVRSTRCDVHLLLGKVWRSEGVSPRVAQGQSTGSLPSVWALLRVCPGAGRSQSTSPMGLVHWSVGVTPVIAQVRSPVSSGVSGDRSGLVWRLVGVGLMVRQGTSRGWSGMVRAFVGAGLRVRSGVSGNWWVSLR